MILPFLLWLTGLCAFFCVLAAIADAWTWWEGRRLILKGEGND